MDNKKIWVILGIILLVVYLQAGGKMSKKTACTAPENAEVIFRTNVNGKFGNFFTNRDTTWIALRYDTNAYTETDYLVPYKYKGINVNCNYDSTLINTQSFVFLPYTAPNGASLSYKTSSSYYGLISIFEPTNCPIGNYTRSWYSYNNTIPSELSPLPTEPYTSNCQEVYKTITPPTNLYPAFLTSKSDYLNGGLFSEFIIKANEWVLS